MKAVLILGAMVAVFAGLASNAQAGSGVVFGLNDDGFRTNCSQLAPHMAPFGNIQVGVWVTPDDASSWCTAPDRGILLQLVGCKGYYAAHPQAYADQALRIVLQHPNIREIQVCNEPDLNCEFQCESVSVRHTRFYGQSMFHYYDLLRTVREKLTGTGVLVLGFGFSAPYRHWNPADVGKAYRQWYEMQKTRVWHCKAPGTDGVCISAVPMSVSYNQPIMDEFAYHPYCGSQPRITRMVWRTLNRFMHNLPGGTPHLAMTESGVDTLETVGQHGYISAGEPHSRICGRASGTEDQQADQITRNMRQAKNNPKVDFLFNYGFYDEADVNRMQTGILRPDGSKKLAYFAYLAGLSKG